MSQEKQAIFLADLGFGDAGKGTITDYLTRHFSAHTIVRYNGGPQAAHNVITPDGRHHTFSQFGSGMFLPGTKTVLSRFMLINPLNMLNEARHLSALGVSDALQRTWLDRRALVITPFQRAINRLREAARGANRHGSCGEGIGVCMSDSLAYGNAVLFAGDLQDKATLLKKLHFLCDAKREEFAALSSLLPDSDLVRQESAAFADPGYIQVTADVYHYFASCVKLVDDAALDALFAQSGTILFEGAQGVLLDENYAFAPYTTWSTTTFANAQTLVQEHNYTGDVIRLGIVRAYATRHGAGPFPSEDPALTQAIPDPHNLWNAWQQTFRVGYFDLVATRYARDILGMLDYLAVTNLDRFATLPAWKFCTSYRYQGEPQEQRDLSTYFEQDTTGLTAIRVHRPADLVYQEKLTQKLWHCSPLYQTFPSSSASKHTAEERANYLALLEQELDIPLAIISDGPTATDKYLYSDFKRTGNSVVHV